MEQRPVFTLEGVTYVYIQHNNLILMSVTKRNSNVALMFVYLYKLVSIVPSRSSQGTTRLEPVVTRSSPLAEPRWLIVSLLSSLVTLRWGV